MPKICVIWMFLSNWVLSLDSSSTKRLYEHVISIFSRVFFIIAGWWLLEHLPFIDDFPGFKPAFTGDFQLPCLTTGRYPLLWTPAKVQVLISIINLQNFALVSVIHSYFWPLFSHFTMMVIYSYWSHGIFWTIIFPWYFGHLWPISHTQRHPDTMTS